MTVARFSHLTDAELVRHFEPAILTPLETHESCADMPPDWEAA